MSDGLICVFASAILALQGWILLKISNLDGSMRGFDLQLKRIVADQESEKGTRKRANDDFELRLRKLERHHE